MIDYFQYIEAYHRNTLNAVEKEALEEAMKEDSDLKEAVENYPKVEPVLDLLLENDIREQVNQSRRSSTKPRRLIIYSGVAAAILIALAATVWLWTGPGPLSDQLIAKYYNPPLSGLVRGVSEIDSINQSRLLEAHDLMADEKFTDAERIFNELAQQPAIPQAAEAEWGLVILALKKDDLAEARNKSEAIIAQPGHPYQAQAQELIRDLE